MPNIVPFGKYKNQPVEVMAQDATYCEWLMNQGWVAQRYPAIHTLIINHFGEPSDTPAHNALQLRLLDEDLRGRIAMCGALVERPRAHEFHHERYVPLFADIGRPRFEHNAMDVDWLCRLWIPDRHMGHWYHQWFHCIVECKPTLGDDYPAVLRFMHTLKHGPGRAREFPGCKVVLIEEFSSQGGTAEQVQQLFHASGVLLLRLTDLYDLPQITCISQEELPDFRDYCG